MHVPIYFLLKHALVYSNLVTDKLALGGEREVFKTAAQILLKTPIQYPTEVIKLLDPENQILKNEGLISLRDSQGCVQLVTRDYAELTMMKSNNDIIFDHKQLARTAKIKYKDLQYTRLRSVRMVVSMNRVNLPNTYRDNLFYIQKQEIRGVTALQINYLKVDG